MRQGRKEDYKGLYLLARGRVGRGRCGRLYAGEFTVAVDEVFRAGHGHLGLVWETHDVFSIVKGVRLLAIVAPAVALLGLRRGFQEAGCYAACFSAHLQHRTSVSNSCF